MPEVIIIAAVVVVLAVIVSAFFYVAKRPPTRPPELDEASPDVLTPPLEETGAPVELQTPEQREHLEAGPQAAEPEPRAETPAAERRERPTLRERLARSRRFITAQIAEALGGGATEETWEDLEAALIQADIGVNTATELVEAVRKRGKGVSDPAELQGMLADELLKRFDSDRDRALAFGEDGPSVWLIVGVNGTGKTTTIGKLAYDLTQRGRSVALSASDTFRAAADEQLSVWADRASAHIVKHQPGADPGAVAFDAYRFARARDVEVLMVDTAGRLHTKTPLMDELAKVRRVIEKEGEVHEVLLVIDATAGQNGLVQARQFTEAAGVTGVILTKLDGTAKGGIAVAIEEDLGLPIKLIGVGEALDDLEPFDPKSFVDAILT